VKEFYGLADSLSPDCMFVRNDYGTHKGGDADIQAKCVYYVPPSVCRLMQGTEVKINFTRRLLLLKT
jgi:hypothetical protein